VLTQLSDVARAGTPARVKAPTTGSAFLELRPRAHRLPPPRPHLHLHLHPHHRPLRHPHRLLLLLRQHHLPVSDDNLSLPPDAASLPLHYQPFPAELRSVNKIDLYPISCSDSIAEQLQWSGAQRVCSVWWRKQLSQWSDLFRQPVVRDANQNLLSCFALSSVIFMTQIISH